MKLPLPEPIKHRLRALPQWSAVGVRQPQDLTALRLTVGGHSRDVTLRCVVASLRPLMLAVGLDTAQVPDAPRARLEMLDRQSGRILGTLDLRRGGQSSEAACLTNFYDVLGEQQRCLPWPRRAWNRWMQDRAMRAAPTAGNFSMPPAVVHQVMVFYMCPRPVVAVSVQHAGHRNLFPMDLIGPLGAGRFSLALRTTSPSIHAMVASGRIAIADFAAGEAGLAYALGAHHRKSLGDWAELRLPLKRSRLFDLPVPEHALRVREIEILSSATVGSHQMFVGQIVSEEGSDGGVQLCHVPGIYQRFRELSGQPLAPASGS